ncbi:MAG: DUF3313 domain-containing protein, partial [Planctomycetota bacterium]
LFSMWLVGCAPVRQARSVTTTGFLGNYSLLKKGGEGQPLWVYRNPKANFARYDKVLLDPVTLWKAENSSLEDTPEEELQRLASLLYTMLQEKLANDYTLVKRPGSGVLRIRVALTEAERSGVGMDIISTVLPPFRLLSSFGRIATGTDSFVGSASAEVEITDSESREVLFEAVDREVGQKSVKGMTREWGDVEAAFLLWVNRLSAHLAEERKAGTRPSA